MLNYNLRTKIFMNSQDNIGNLVALLGPTNTGKTYYAINRMTKFSSGIIGCPLRLLAREVYDKLVKKKGLLNIALITGEERIVPDGAKYFVCTVEAMPKDLKVDFVAIDEAQLCNHNDRGHIFTDKILNVKGEQETMFLGSDSLEILLKFIYPSIIIKKMKRFSNLQYTGKTKLHRMPRRSAIVSFSINDVYEIAELVKRKHGGTAVVLGALSPKTRNAQVELYESGEVDYLVATDAIGMGLNMDINHVSFAKVNKFDGRVTRPLTTSELAQIAGRAGRYKSDGTFGATAGCVDFTQHMVNSIENHVFPHINTMVWRNSSLDFSSLRDLLRSLSIMPSKPYLMLSPEADDEKLLKVLSKNEDIIIRLIGKKEIKLLWEICSIPDYSKNFDDSHSKLLEEIFLFIIDKGTIPENWVNKKLNELNNIKGELDLISTRLSNVRTWNYISNHKNWINKKSELGDRARYIENRLSDALHLGLVERFVDYKMAKFSKHLGGESDLIASVSKDNSVLVEGHFIGRIEGFNFINEVSKNIEDKKEVLKVVRRTLFKELKNRVNQFHICDDKDITLDKNMNIYWKKYLLAKLISGPSVIKPRIYIQNFILLDDLDKNIIRKRLVLFLKKMINNSINPLIILSAKFKEGKVRGLIYQLNESLGVIQISRIKELVKALSTKDKEILTNSGVKIEELFIWVPKLFENNQAQYFWYLRQVFFEVKDREPYPAIEKPINLKNSSKELIYANEFILIGDSYYHVELIEKIMAKFKSIMSSHNIFFLNKKNMTILNRNFNITRSQFKLFLNKLNYERDKINPVKYTLKNKKEVSKDLVLKNKNSPFSVLKNLKIN